MKRPENDKRLPNAIKKAIYEQHQKENFNYDLTSFEKQIIWDDYVKPKTDYRFLMRIFNKDNFPTGNNEQILIKFTGTMKISF